MLLTRDSAAVSASSDVLAAPRGTAGGGAGTADGFQSAAGVDHCFVCAKRVYPAERCVAGGKLSRSSRSFLMDDYLMSGRQARER